MKKNVPENYSNKSSTVKEISDGVYINLNRITTDEQAFEKAIEESFKKLEKNNLKNVLKTDNEESELSS